jgi:nucleoside-diphosphate-sugar epimerase
VLAADYEVITPGRRGAGPRVDLVTTPLGEIAQLFARLRPAIVVNCVGAISGDAMIETNVLAVARLVAALRQGAPGAALIHLGSAGEYGAIPGQAPISEQARCRPVGEYGVTKLAGTGLVQAAVQDAGVRACVLRVFNPIGPGATGASLAGRLALELARDPGAELIVGPLDAYRDVVDARDVARAVALVVAAFVARRRIPSLLNVASGQATQLRELVRALRRLAGATGGLHENGAGSPRSASVAWQRADITAIGETVGWSPQIPLERSLTDALAEARERRTEGNIGRAPLPTV